MRRALAGLEVSSSKPHGDAAPRLRSPTSGQETFLLAVVLAGDEAHELAHDVAVEVGRAEGVGGDRPAGREDDKVRQRGAGLRPCPDGEARRTSK